MPSDVLEDFVFDSREHLANAGAQLLALEKSPDSLANLNALLGTIHTIKGNSGFVNQRHLFDLLHSSESLLQTVRETPDRSCPENVIDVLFQVLDTAEAIMGRLENDQDDEVDWLPALLDAIREVSDSLEWTEVPEEAGVRAAEEAASASAADETPEGEAAPAPAPADGTGAGEEAVGTGAAEETGAGAEGGETARAAEAEETEEVAGGEPGGPPIFDPSKDIQYLKLDDGDLLEKGDGYVSDSLALMDNGNGGEGLVLDMRSVSRVTTPEVRCLEQLILSWGPRLAFVLPEEKRADYQRLFKVLDLRGDFGIYPKEESAFLALRESAGS
ncbi:MAG: Hpt domain-containing protein [Deltaproteobacteria bacterium]|jgi:hypothetical protein|nr:Hpt domain-containing protein [Deltaproteobacteria bacterium]